MSTKAAPPAVAPVARPDLAALLALLLELFRAEARAAVAEALDAQQPLADWTDIRGIAAHLGVSEPTVRKLDLPFVYVGQHRRYSRRSCESHLVARSQPSSQIAEAAE